MSIANYLTFIRLLVGPIFMFIYTEHAFLNISSTTLPYALLALLSISELSDALDGFFARKYNQVTDLGKVLDPMADSIARIAVFLTFTLPPVSLPVPLVFIFIFRDSIVSTLRTVCALHHHALAASISGKIKAVLQAAASFVILFLMIPHSTGTLSTAALQQTGFWFVSLAAAYAVFSAVEYIYTNRRYIHKLLTLKNV